MATKSYKIRLDLRLDQPIVDANRFNTRADEIRSTHQWLDDTRVAFNTGVDYLTGWLLKMHRGAGVSRAKHDGIWREWREITTTEELQQARQRNRDEPQLFALLENHELLNAFKGKSKSEAEAIELAECCRRIMAEIAPPADEGQQVQMNRSDLDLLTLPASEARGVRPKSAAKDGSKKKTSGKRPGWMLDKAIFEECDRSDSLDVLFTRLRQRQEFQSAMKDGEKKIKALKKYQDGAWPEAKSAIMKPHTDGRPKWEVAEQKWKDKRRNSEQSGAVSAYKALVAADSLPLPGLARPSDRLKLAKHIAEWNYAIWNMAGQRVRSHLGWVRRRAKERLLWELRTNLFEYGGWLRTRRHGKAIRQKDATPDDIRFEAPPASEIADFQQRAAHGKCKWVETLREYETGEMFEHLEGVAFGAADQPRIRKRTAKGWASIRDRWIDLTNKAQSNPTADDLLDAFDRMRGRKPRDFGDRRFFEWLAAPERRWLWDGTGKGGDTNCGRDDRDCVSAYIAHNEHLADKPDSITFTRSDSVKHPVWPFFGENSAIEYQLAREVTPDGNTRLVLVLGQLLVQETDGSYSAVDRVKIALRGYEDFEKSFAIPDNAKDVSAKQEIVFHDDLLGGTTRHGTLSGMKLTWERDELEASHRKCKPSRKLPRIYAIFSCDAGAATLPEWLTKHVGSDVKLKKPRDGMTRAFFLKKTISQDGAAEGGETRRPSGERKWPKEAVENGFSIRGTDLGYRTSSAGAYWRLSFCKPEGKISWKVGTCGRKPVHAVLERTSTVLLPGDGELLPTAEQALRERLYSLRTRLNLNNALLRIARLLALDSVTQRKPDGDKLRKRSDGTTKRIGTKWRTEIRHLDDTDIKENCRKAAVQLVRWASTDAMAESLKAIGYHGSLWDWFSGRDNGLERLAGLLPKTEVPTEKDANEKGIDRENRKAERKKEDDAFADAIHELRGRLANVLCFEHDAKKRRRGKSGLWFEFDRALLCELSYSDRGNVGGEQTIFDSGLFRLLRKPPVTKHHDRKDDVNNLPHGRTHRGGLSMARLNFLDDVKNFVRRWSCRPRWPGDLRRVPENAKIDRCDTEHLDHLREHRAKLIAHADVAQTLGFEQDFRRGLWQYRDGSGESAEIVWHRPERGHFYRRNGDSLVQCDEPAGLNDAGMHHPHAAYDPAHVLVYEDLTRYKMSSDRPKNENAGLARWSHRRILAFAQHVGGLFGVPVATVDARFSSRYCSRCGAPGCRAVRFDPAWLNQGWMQTILQSTDIRDAALKSVATHVRSAIEKNLYAFGRETDRPWVLRDGGTHFVCANSTCPVHSTPVNADENAAANIGLRFLRGVDGIRATIAANGTVTRSIGYVPRGMVLLADGNEGPSQNEPYWRDASADSRLTGSSKSRRGDRQEPTREDAIEDDESGVARVLFRDPSGKFRCQDHWFEGKVFWGGVARSCAACIKAVNASRFASDEGD